MEATTERRLKDIGLLVLRLGIGGMFVYWHGWPKISGGTKEWTQIGHAMANLGVTGYPAFWGFMSALAEFVGGICLAVGLFFRPACAFLAFNMFVAALLHYYTPAMRPMLSYPIEMGIVVVSLLLIGPGDYALGRALWGRKG